MRSSALPAHRGRLVTRLPLWPGVSIQHWCKPLLLCCRPPRLSCSLHLCLDRCPPAANPAGAPTCVLAGAHRGRPVWRLRLPRLSAVCRGAAAEDAAAHGGQAGQEKRLSSLIVASASATDHVFAAVPRCSSLIRQPSLNTANCSCPAGPAPAFIHCCPAKKNLQWCPAEAVPITRQSMCRLLGATPCSEACSGTESRCGDVVAGANELELSREGGTGKRCRQGKEHGG